MSDLFSILCIAPKPVLLDRDMAVICSVGDACLETFMCMLWDNTNDELLGRLDQSVLDTSISVPDSEILKLEQYFNNIVLTYE